MRMCHFLAQNGPFVLNKSFLGTKHHYYFHQTIGPLHCEKFEKFSQQIQSYEDATFWGPKWSVYPEQFFF